MALIFLKSAGGLERQTNEQVFSLINELSVLFQKPEVSRE